MNQYIQHSKMLSELKTGQQVRIQDEDTKHWNKLRRIVKNDVHRKYLMKLANGKQLRRDKEFLRPFEEELLSLKHGVK